MQKWEYLEVEVAKRNFASGPMAERVNDRPNLRAVGEKKMDYPRFYQFANELGEQGWEMCGIAGSDDRNFFVAYFRRPSTQ